MSDQKEQALMVMSAGAHCLWAGQAHSSGLARRAGWAAGGRGMGAGKAMGAGGADGVIWGPAKGCWLLGEKKGAVEPLDRVRGRATDYGYGKRGEGERNITKSRS